MKPLITIGSFDPVKRYRTVTKNLWEGDPEGHSEAAIKGWDKRGRGKKPIGLLNQPWKYYRGKLNYGSQNTPADVSGLFSFWINKNETIRINLRRDWITGPGRGGRDWLSWSVDVNVSESRPEFNAQKYSRDFKTREEALRYVTSLRKSLSIADMMGALRK